MRLNSLVSTEFGNFINVVQYCFLEGLKLVLIGLLGMSRSSNNSFHLFIDSEYDSSNIFKIGLSD